MRIRSIKPEFWRSGSISSLSIENRLLFIGLWSYVDDNGVGIDKLSVIAADLFADDVEREPRETFARVSRGLATLSEAGRIVRYRASGRDLLAVVNWDEHQRIDKPAKPRYPLPTREDIELRETVATPSRDRRETPATGTGEQGNRGTGERGSSESTLTGASSSAIASDRDADPRPEVRELCNLLADRVQRNGHKVGTVGKTWFRACRLLLDVDGHSAEQVQRAIEWATTDPFWSTNIRSMQTLREKYTTLRAQATTRVNGGSRRQQETDDIFTQAAQRLGVTTPAIEGKPA